MKNKYRILIVEDDEVIAHSIQKLMGDWGWEACCVEDFSKVLDTFASYNPHLVILDIALPACNGGDPENFPGAGGFPLLGLRQHEYRHCHEYGRG